MAGYLPSPEPLSPLRSSFAFSSDLPFPLSPPTQNQAQQAQSLLSSSDPTSNPPSQNTAANLSLSIHSSVPSSATSSVHTSPASASSSSIPSSPVTTWTNHHVKDWLESLNCGSYYRAFEENHIAGDILLECDNDSLRDLGITKVGDRIRIQQSLKQLRRKTAELDASLAQTASRAQASKRSSFSSTLTPANNQHLKAAILPRSPGSHVNSPVEGFFTQSSLSSSRTSDAPPELPPKPRHSSYRTHPNHHHNYNSSIQQQQNLPHSAPTSATADSHQNTIQAPERQPPATFINIRGQCVAVNVSRYFDTISVKKKAIKKFSSKQLSVSDPKSSQVSSPGTSTFSSSFEKIKPETCIIFVTDPEKSSGVRQLSDFELITVCHSINRHERDRLMICPKNTTPTQAQIASSKQIMKNLSNSKNADNKGSSASNPSIATDSSAYYRTSRSANSLQSFEDSDSSYKNLLSSPNISSGKFLPVHKPSNRHKSKSAHESDTSSDSKSRKSFTDVKGFRPESMHISKNLQSLQEYFPEAGTQALQQTIRNSQMYTKRMSRMSQRSSIAMYLSGDHLDDDAPPIPSLEDVWNSTYGMGTMNSIRNSQQLFPTGPNQNSSSSSASSSPALPSSSNALYNHRNSSNLSASNGSNAPTLMPQLGNRDHSENYSSTVSLEEKMLPPVPGQRPGAQQSNTISRRASNMSIRSTASNHNGPSDFQNTFTAGNGTFSDAINDTTASTTTPASNEIPDSEEEFMELFKREQSGPSRWIKGAFIGSGSFGTVYLGLNSITGELMAVKQVELMGDKGSEHEQRKRSMIDALQREMNLLRDLQHPNIVQYLGSNCENNYLNIFLEYVPGGSVASLLTGCGAFEELHIRKVVKQILHGLKYLHSRSIIHRDIKGANILMDTRGNVKISDFGISKKLDDDKKGRASLQGSIYWMAPEVVRQKPYSFKADIWSLGCLIVEMYTGQRPFPELQHFQALFNIGKETPVPPTIPAHASPEGQDFLKKAFEIDYHKRPTATEMLQHPFVKQNGNQFGNGSGGPSASELAFSLQNRMLENQGVI